MNDSTKARHAIERELEEMRNSIKRFDLVVAEAHALAKDCRASADRAETALRELRLDQAIERADYLLKRGPYLPLREEAPTCCTQADGEPSRIEDGRCVFCGTAACPAELLEDEGPTEFVGLEGFVPSTDGRRSFFATFGAGHRHVLKFGTADLVLDGDGYIEIFAACEEAARAFMFEKFDRKWCTTYTERPEAGLYRRGCVYQVALPISYGEENVELEELAEEV